MEEKKNQSSIIPWAMVVGMVVCIVTIATSSTRLAPRAYEILTTAGLKGHDIALLLLCPIGAILGSLAHTALLLMNPDRLPVPGKARLLVGMDVAARVSWLSMRVFLGGLLGLLFAVYFVGTLQESLTPLCKLVTFSVLIGYAAPKLWIAQEKVLMNKLDERIKRVMNEKSKEDSAA